MFVTEEKTWFVIRNRQRNVMTPWEMTGEKTVIVPLKRITRLKRPSQGCYLCDHVIKGGMW